MSVYVVPGQDDITLDVGDPGDKTVTVTVSVPVAPSLSVTVKCAM